MPTHAERRHFPYTSQQLFDLVADIEKYPEFLPWCVGARVIGREGEEIKAELVIGFKMLRERFISKVTLHPPNSIEVAYLDGPFKYLNNNWGFEAAADGGTVVDFHVDFEFRSRILQGVIGALFNEAVRLMVSSFEKRARQLYGPDGRGARPVPTV